MIVFLEKHLGRHSVQIGPELFQEVENRYERQCVVPCLGSTFQCYLKKALIGARLGQFLSSAREQWNYITLRGGGI